MRSALRSVLTLSVVAIVALALTAAPVNSDLGSNIIDVEWLMEDCTQTTPAALSVQGVTDDGEAIPLEVLVLLDVQDGYDLELALLDPDLTEEEREALLAPFVDKAAANLAPGTKSYAEVAVSLNYSEFDLLRRLQPDGTERARTDHPQQLMDRAKGQYGGARPEGFDIVYVLTDLDLRLPPPINNNVIGMADCIGGVRYADRAFGVGQWGLAGLPDGGFPIGPITLYKDFVAKVAAHEIGHLMGGHHHYQSCGDAAAKAVGNGEPGPCSLMTNAIDFQAYPFSALNGAVVRGHAVEFVDPDEHDHDH